MIYVARGSLGNEELNQVKEAFDYGYFGHEYKVEQFEKEICKYLNTDYAVAVNTGTSALHIALDIIGIGPGDEVIVPSLTFVATYQVITALGAVPISCDIYEDTLLINIEDVKKKITNKTKAIIPVHYAGNPCNMDELLKIKEKYNIRIIEDAAHAFGSTYNKNKIGSFGDIACFSFDSIKIITCGEGGAVVSRNKEEVELMKIKRKLGIEKVLPDDSSIKDKSVSFNVKTMGYRYHMSNINGGIGLAQIKKVDKFINRRREICDLYNKAFRNLNFIELLKIDYSKIAPFMYVVKVKKGKRNEFKEYLLENEIETTISYVPNHLHTLYKNENDNLVVSEGVYNQIIGLPLHFGLANSDVEYVIEKVKSFANKNVLAEK